MKRASAAIAVTAITILISPAVSLAQQSAGGSSRRAPTAPAPRSRRVPASIPARRNDRLCRIAWHGNGSAAKQEHRRCRSARKTRRSIARSRAFAAAAASPFAATGRAEVSKIAQVAQLELVLDLIQDLQRSDAESVEISECARSRRWVMLRKIMIALFASASVAMLVPDAASARGGFGGGGGGFHGGGGFGGGGFRGGGGFGGGGFRGGMGGGGFRAAAIGGGGFRSAAIGGRWFPSAAIGGGFRSAAFARVDFAAAPCRQPVPRWLPPRFPAPEISGCRGGSRR